MEANNSVRSSDSTFEHFQKSPFLLAFYVVCAARLIYFLLEKFLEHRVRLKFA